MLHLLFQRYETVFSFIFCAKQCFSTRKLAMHSSFRATDHTNCIQVPQSNRLLSSSSRFSSLQMQLQLGHQEPTCPSSARPLQLMITAFSHFGFARTVPGHFAFSIRMLASRNPSTNFGRLSEHVCHSALTSIDLLNLLQFLLSVHTCSMSPKRRSSQLGQQSSIPNHHVVGTLILNAHWWRKLFRAVFDLCSSSSRCIQCLPSAPMLSRVICGSRSANPQFAKRAGVTSAT